MKAIIVNTLSIALGIYAMVQQDEMMYFCASLGILVGGTMWLTKKLEKYEL